MSLARASLVATMLALALSLNAAPALAAPTTVVVGDYSFSYDGASVGAGATIVEYLGSSISPSIPATVDIDSVSYSVTTIGDHAFEGKGLTAVTIPDSVATIRSYAFSWNELASVTIPDSVTAIGPSAFMSNLLTSVTIPNSVTAIRNATFQANDLTAVTIPDSVTTIEVHAFNMNDLSSVTFGDSTTAIGDRAFAENRITSVTIPDSVTTIGKGAFGYNSLTSVTVGSSVTTLGQNAFYPNPQLREVLMRGPAPSSTGTCPFGEGGSYPVVSYYGRFASSGYATPTWIFGEARYPTKVIGPVAQPDEPAPDPVESAIITPSPQLTPTTGTESPSPSPTVSIGFDNPSPSAAPETEPVLADPATGTGGGAGPYVIAGVGLLILAGSGYLFQVRMRGRRVT